MNIRSSIAIAAALLTISAASIAAEPAKARVKVDSGRHWKEHHFAMTNWFYKHKWSDPEEQIRILAEAGYQGVKLSLKADPKRWKRLPAYLKALKEHGLQLTAIHCGFSIENGTYPQVIKDNLPLLKDSGVILVPSIGSRKKAGRRDPAAVESAVKILREMSDDARRFGLGGIAPYMHINNWAETIDDCLFLAQKVDRDNVGVMFHLHHWTAVAQREAGAGFHADQAALRAALELAKPYLMLVVVQGQDNDKATHKIVGEGSFDLRPLVRALADLKYEGPLGTMGYTQSGDIPGKLDRAQKAWIKIRDEATTADYKADVALAKAVQPAEKKPAVKPAAKPGAASIKRVRASDSLEGYPAEHAFDADPATRWSVLGSGHWLQVDLSEPVTIDAIGIGFAKGQRRYKIEISHSVDGEKWDEPVPHQSSGAGEAVEYFKGDPLAVRSIRIAANGSNASAWNNIHTVLIPGVNASAAAPQSPAKPSPAPGGKLVATEFASVGMIGSAVGISVDHQGRVFATHTNRRNNGALDIRKHADWLEQSLASRSVEDKRKLIRGRKKDWEKLFKFKELIVRLADTDGDGKADERLVIHEGFNTEVHGLAGGILAHEGDAFVACIPGFYKLIDRDGDGVMEEVQEIADGLGIHVGYGGHDMHGPTLGPDGRIYWSIGDKAFTVIEDGEEHCYQGHGGVLRIEPDGSGYEVFAHGLRNPQELAFDEFGNLFTVDNDGDFGDRERVHYVAEGTDSGWRAHYQYRSNNRWKHLGGYNPWIAEELWKPAHEGQATYMTPCIANYSTGPIGFAYNPGTALNAKYRRHFFLAESNKQIAAFQVEPEGAGFKMLAPHTVLKGPFVTGVNFGPDGALYLADWGNNGWAPHNKGRILKLDDPAAVTDPARLETCQLLAEDPADKDLETLRNLLRHADQRVRLVAQFELVKRGKPGLAQLAEAARQDENQLARIHAIWGLGQAARKDRPSAEPVLALLKDADPEIRAQAAKVLGDARLSSAADAISSLLDDESPRVRHLAGIALAKLAAPQHLDKAVAMIVGNENGDVFVRHGGIVVMAAIAKADPDRIAALARHASTDLRLAAVVALRRARAPQVATFLGDLDPRVVAEAALAIHDDDSIPAALPQLAAVLDRPGLTDPAVLRRAISANRRLGEGVHAQRLAAFAARESAPEAMRVEAIDTLAQWTSPITLDRVQGFHRGLPAADRAAAIAALDRTIGQLLASKSDALRQATTRLIGGLEYGDAAKRMEQLASDETQEVEIRCAALAALHALKSPVLPKVLRLARAASSPTLRATALEIVSQSDPLAEETWSDVQRAIASKNLGERRGALAAAARIESDRATAFLRTWLARLESGDVPPELQLDVFLAADQASSDELKKAASALKGTDGYHGFALRGGDADVGKGIFQTSVTAQCIRCHSVGGDGSTIGVGPDLAAIATKKDRAYLLRSITEPSADIAEGYRLETFTLKSGAEHSGNVVNEDGKLITLRDGSEIKVDEVAKRTAHDVSAMPPLAAILSMAEIRDLVAYLSSLK